MTLEEIDQTAGFQPYQELPELRSDRVFARHETEAKGPAPHTRQPDM
jgi:hypothetical protein